MKAPIYNIDLNQFWINPYPDLKLMRHNSSIAFVPQLNATLFTKRNMVYQVLTRVHPFRSCYH